MRFTAPFLLVALVYAAFVSLGLPDSALGVAWPVMRRGLALPLEAVGLLTLVTTACSTLSGLASGWTLERLGTGRVVALSCLLTGGALLGYSFAPSFAWLLVFALPLGLGAGSVDAGLNHFVAERWSSRHMSWLHASWGVGATIGPAVLAWAVAGPGWAAGYRLIALVQLGLAALFIGSLGLWPNERVTARSGGAEAASARTAAGTAPAWAAWLAPSLYLVYAAVEAGTGLWAASILVEARGLPEAKAGLLMSCFFGAITAGRVLSGLVADRVGNRRMARLGILLAAAGAALFGAASFAASPAALSAAGLALLGLGCAPVYPCLMHETPRRFDERTVRRVVGRQVAFAYVGAALVPPAYGLLAAKAGLEALPLGIGLAALLLLGLSELLNSRT